MGSLVHLRDVHVAFDGVSVLRGASLSLNPGEHALILGPSGSGKTTLLNVLARLIAPERGDFEFRGQPVATHGSPAQFRRRHIGYAFQELHLLEALTVEQNILAILETLNLGRAERRERAAALLDELSLTPLAKSPAHTLSGGERRRVEITRALVMSPSFILLDEPFAGIDPIAVTDIQAIISHLKERGIGALITDHNVRETLRITDRAYIVHDGAVFRKGTPADLANDDEVKRIYLGADFRLD